MGLDVAKQSTDSRGSWLDELDFRLLFELQSNPKSTYKDISHGMKIDQRTVAKRISRLEKRKVVAQVWDIDWPRAGIRADAMVGCTTAHGEKSVVNFLDFVKSDPRIVLAYETIGSHQYFLRILESDLHTLRDSVLRELEPLTSELSTSLISSEVKHDDLSFLRYVMETTYPRTRRPH